MDLMWYKFKVYDEKWNMNLQVASDVINLKIISVKMIQSLFLQWFVKLMGPSLFSFIILIVFFLG